MNPVYRLSRVLLRAGVHAYYEVHVVRAERVPDDVPAIFASNHPNSLLDPFVIGGCLGRQLNFVAKSTLFTGPRGAFLKAAGTIPVTRKQDTGDTSGNVATFQSCFEVLEGKGALGIFPEGISHTDPQLKQIKTGAARIAFEAEERRGWTLGVKLIPVGLWFAHAPRLRSKVIVRFGHPIAISHLRDAYGKDPKAAVLDLTAELEQALEKLIVHIEELSQTQIVADVRRIYLDEIVGERKGNLDTELQATQEIARAAHIFLRKDPERASRLARRVSAYLRLVDRVGLNDKLLKQRGRDVHVTSETARFVWGAFLLPIAIYGLVVNYFPIRAAYWAGRLFAPTASVVATARFFAGLVLVLCTYPLEIFLAWKAWGTVGASIFATSLPTTGLLAVRYPHLFSVVVDRLRSVFFRKTRRRFIVMLRRRRARLVSELDLLRKEYLSLRDGVASEGAPAGPALQTP